MGGEKALPNVVDEKFPMIRVPFFAGARAADALKTNSMRRYQIEFLPQIGQGSVRIDPRDDPPNPQHIESVAKKLMVIQIETERVVSERFTNVEKIACATAEIENAQRCRAIEPEVLCPFDINSNPVRNIGEPVYFWRARTLRILCAQLRRCHRIESRQNTTIVNRMKPAGDVLDDTLGAVAGQKFLQLVRNSHKRREILDCDEPWANLRCEDRRACDRRLLNARSARSAAETSKSRHRFAIRTGDLLARRITAKKRAGRFAPGALKLCADIAARCPYQVREFERWCYFRVISRIVLLPSISRSSTRFTAVSRCWSGFPSILRAIGSNFSRVLSSEAMFLDSVISRISKSCGEAESPIRIL